MCYNYKPTNRKKISGYKVVAELDGKYFSLLTGEEYQTNGDIPVWHNQQNQIYNGFCKVLPGDKKDQQKMENADGPAEDTAFRKLFQCVPWNKEMVGRTFVFTNLRKFKKSGIFMWGGSRPPFNIVLVKVALEKDLLEAEYDECRVFVGKKLTIFNQVAFKYHRKWVPIIPLITSEEMPLKALSFSPENIKFKKE